jgi:hypothetical protein
VTRCHMALALLLAATVASAQAGKPLDMRLKTTDEGAAPRVTVCTVCGEIRSIREVPAGRLASEPALRPERSTPQSDLRQPLPMGAVVYVPLGVSKDDEYWRFGAAGTPEMQLRLAESTYEITVLMDDGKRRRVLRRDGAHFKVGQRVALRDGGLEPM